MGRWVLRALHVEQCSLQDRTRSMAQWAEGMGLSVASNIEIMHQLRRFGLAKFAGAVMCVLREVFGMPEQYMICPANEKEGRFLLNEIMMAGNFGAFDQRIKRDYRLRMNDYRLSLPRGMVHAIEKTKHNLRLVRHYPKEVMWEPGFRVYHWIWRRFELWRY